MRTLPFALDRASRQGLVEQIVEGLRAAIVSGTLRKGETLPSRQKMAAELGVGECTVRLACARLASEKMLEIRRRVGCVVAGRPATPQKGSVLHVRIGDSGSFAAAVFTHELQRTLFAGGFMSTVLSFPSDLNSAAESARLKVALASRPDCVLVCSSIGNAPKLERLLAGSMCPYLTMFMGMLHKGNCIGSIEYDASEAIKDFVADCVRAKIRHVLQLDFGKDTYADAQAFLVQANIAVERISIVLDGNDLDGCVDAAAEAVRRRLQRGRLPDLLFLSDDYVAAGAISTLYERGVRIPRDVRVVAYTNVGSGSFYHRLFACLEFDPRADGRNVAEAILRWARFRKELGPCVSRPVYRRGSTFPVA